MPFYLRDYVKAGPLRFNLSKSGVGVSMGVRGLRVGTGPRGHYLHAGRNGIYYRTSLNGKSSPKPAVERPRIPELSPNVPAAADDTVMVEIESGDVLAMTDGSSAELLDDLNDKQRRWRFSTMLGLMGCIAALVVTFGAGAPGTMALAAAAIASGTGWGIGKWIDGQRRVAILLVDLDPDARTRFEAATGAFDELVRCVGKWHLASEGQVTSATIRKRNAGADQLVRRQPIALDYRLPAILRCNLTPPAIPVGKQWLYFLPDAVLVEDRGQFGAVTYDELKIAIEASQFIEEEAVPADAVVVGQTWKYPNRDGGPDRRFKDNHKIPICLYETLRVTSVGGLNEAVQLSRCGVAHGFAQALRALRQEPKPATQPPAQTAKRGWRRV